MNISFRATVLFEGFDSYSQAVQEINDGKQQDLQCFWGMDKHGDTTLIVKRRQNVPAV